MRDLAVTAVVFAVLPLCLAHPWIGVLVWSWLGYMNPHRLTWGFARTMPFAQMVAIATLVGLHFTKDRNHLPRTREVYLLVALWGFFLITTVFALQPDEAWAQLEKVSKILLMTFVTLFLFQDPKKLRALLYVIALSIGFYGLKGGIWAVLTGGQNQVLGPEDTFIGGNTEIGLALNMVLPILLLLSKDEERQWLRYLLRTTFAFSVIAVLITYSRGAILGLAVVLPLLFLKSRAKLVLLPLALVAYFFGPSLMQSVMPEQWLERMGTIKTYEEDRSARQRLNAWYVSYRLALDHPFLGAGFRPFSPEIYLKYSPEEASELSNTQSDAHSIYFQVLAEHGFTGLALYGGLILSTMLSLKRVIRKSRRESSLHLVYDAGQMLEISLVGYLVAGAFLSMSYFDLFFHLVSIVIILKVLVERSTPESSQISAPVLVRRDRVRR